MESFFQRTWAQIDLDAVEHNYKVIRSQVNPQSKMMCVIKADAYGHGAVRLAQTYEQLGADWFAVSNLEEALQLRYAGIKRPMLILGYTPPQMAAQLSEYDIAQAVLSEEYAVQLSACATESNTTVDVHIAVDTGMSRIGLVYQNAERDAGAVDCAERICHMDGLHVQGIFTHFTVADESEDGKVHTEKQYDDFTGLIHSLESRGIRIPLRHCCNSGAIMDYAEMNLDMVRPGIILYGLAPSEKLKNRLKLQPVMQLKTIISQIKTMEPQTAVSYGRTFIAQSTMRIATVPIGYADGYPRAMSNKAEMLVCGQRAPIIGRVCMDQLMLDVTHIPAAKVGSVVTVFGCDEDETLSVDELAALNGTINYEMVCLVGKRVPRIYYKDNSIVGEMNYLCPKE